MLAAILLEPGRIELGEVPTPAPGPGEVLLRVEAALTCGTDIKTYRRGHPRIPLPSPMGHEASGTVAAVGEGVNAFAEGDTVVYAPTAPCGSCRLCRRGHEPLCPDAVGRMVFGAFAEYVLLPAHVVARNTFRRPVGLAPETGAGLEPLAAVLHGAGRVALERAERVVLVGDGPIALLFLQVALRAGAGGVMVAGHHAARLDVALALGAERVADGPADAVGDGVMEWSDGAGADVVVECVGRPEAWEQAAELVAPGGELLVYGGCAAGTRASFDTYRIHYEEVDVKGAFHYAPSDVERALDLLRSNDVAMAPLVTHTLPLEELEEALRLVIEREALKVALVP